MAVTWRSQRYSAVYKAEDLGQQKNFGRFVPRTIHFWAKNLANNSRPNLGPQSLLPSGPWIFGRWPAFGWNLFNGILGYRWAKHKHYTIPKICQVLYQHLRVTSYSTHMFMFSNIIVIFKKYLFVIMGISYLIIT